MITETIDQCQPWPTHPQVAAETVRDTIEEGSQFVMDCVSDAITEITSVMAQAAADEFYRGQDEARAPEWTDGAAYVLGVVLSHLAPSMSPRKFKRFTEELADALAPLRADDL